jgi:hypothetical protein
MISPKSASHIDPARVLFNIGDRVCWNLAARWKLKNTMGSVVAVLDVCLSEKPMYKVEFPFGVIVLHAGQIARVDPDWALPRTAEKKASPVRRKKAYHTTDGWKGGMLIPRAKASVRRK